MADTNNSQVEVGQRKMLTLRTLLDQSKKQFEAALPKHLKADRLIRIALTSVRKNPRLLECEPQSFIGALMLSAQLGLEPDDGLGEAYLIPRRNKRAGTVECNFQPGYKGLVKLAQNSGQIASIACNVVREGDFLEYEKGISDKLVHRESATSFDAAITHAWAVVKTQNGGVYWDCWPVQKIEAHRKRYAPDSYDGYSAWQTNYDWMCMKTVIIQALKLAPKSVELQRAVALNEQSEAGLPQDAGTIDLGVTFSAPPAEQAKTPLQALTDTLNQESAKSTRPNELNELIGEIREFEDWTLENELLSVWTEIHVAAGVPDTRNLKSLGVAKLRPLVEAIRAYRGNLAAPKGEVKPTPPPAPKSFHDEVDELLRGTNDRTLLYDLIAKHGGERGVMNFNLGPEKQRELLAEFQARVGK